MVRAEKDVKKRNANRNRQEGKDGDAHEDKDGGEDDEEERGQQKEEEEEEEEGDDDEDEEEEEEEEEGGGGGGGGKGLRDRNQGKHNGKRDSRK